MPGAVVASIHGPVLHWSTRNWMPRTGSSAGASPFATGALTPISRRTLLVPAFSTATERSTVSPGSNAWRSKRGDPSVSPTSRTVPAWMVLNGLDVAAMNEATVRPMAGDANPISVSVTIPIGRIHRRINAGNTDFTGMPRRRCRSPAKRAYMRGRWGGVVRIAAFQPRCSNAARHTSNSAISTNSPMACPITHASPGRRRTSLTREV